MTSFVDETINILLLFRNHNRLFINIFRDFFKSFKIEKQIFSKKLFFLKTCLKISSVDGIHCGVEKG